MSHDHRTVFALAAICGLAAGAAPSVAQQEEVAGGRVLAQAAKLLTPGAADAPGPDVIVGDISDIYEPFGNVVGGIRSYGVGTTSCNLGTVPLKWVSGTNEHPAIAQNMFRLHDGRLEQIGMGWLKHGYTALQQSLCSSCQSSGTGSLLGVGCSDPYSGSLNASQSRLGPRSDINVTSGGFPYPYTIAFQQTGDGVYKRCQVLQSDLTTAGALYFADAQYVTPDDALSGNGLNNASYRRVTVNTSTYDLTVQGTTFRTKPGIFAWKEHGLGVGVSDPDVLLESVDYTEQGLTARFWIASKVRSLGNGAWRYEYAVYNLNSHRSAGSFSVPMSENVSATNVTFHAPLYHSGEVYQNAPWVSAKDASEMTWSTPQRFTENPNTSALRWSTMYNFGFDSTMPPAVGQATIGFFRAGAAGDPDSLPAPAWVPMCYANCDASVAAPALNVGDFTCFLQRFAAGEAYANCDGSTAAPVLNVTDFTCFLQSFAAGCN